MIKFLEVLLDFLQSKSNFIFWQKNREISLSEGTIRNQFQGNLLGISAPGSPRKYFGLNSSACDFLTETRRGVMWTSPLMFLLCPRFVQSIILHAGCTLIANLGIEQFWESHLYNSRRWRLLWSQKGTKMEFGIIHHVTPSSPPLPYHFL